MTEQQIKPDLPDVQAELYDNPDGELQFGRKLHSGSTIHEGMKTATIRQWFVSDDGLTEPERLLAAMTVRAERAEAVVEKLPVTADGVRVVPNMKVWFVYTDGSGVCNDFAPDMGMMDGEWAMYYSTPEAAQAAIDAKGGA